MPLLPSDSESDDSPKNSYGERVLNRQASRLVFGVMLIAAFQVVPLIISLLSCERIRHQLFMAVFLTAALVALGHWMKQRFRW